MSTSAFETFSKNIAKSQTGREILVKDFMATAIGPIEAWPASLRSHLTMLLACPTAMFLAWGPDLQCFYNDAYRPILGYRVDTAMGEPFRAVWASIWDDIGPLVTATLAGETRVMTDMKLDLSRAGAAEESWWTFSYSPLFDDNGMIAGMLCVTAETTARVVAERERDEADARLNLALTAGNTIGTWEWDVATDWVRADERFARLYGLDPDHAFKGAPIAEFFGGIHPEDLPHLQSSIQKTLSSGGTFNAEYRLLSKNGDVRWVSAQGGLITGEVGNGVQLSGVSYDITDRVVAETSVRLAKEERDFVISLTARQRVGHDSETIIRSSAQALGKRLGVNRLGFYRLLNEDLLRHSANWTDGSLAPLKGEQAVDGYGKYAERLRRSGKTLIFSDSRHDHDGDLVPYSEAGVLSGICVPLMNGGRWQAGIYAHHAEVRHWAPSEIALIKEVAELTWLSVERAEALMRLSQRVDQKEAELAEKANELETQKSGKAEVESQLRQLQKMEAVGQLTGGIAHDFNNMLALIVGGLNLTQRKLARGDTDVGKYLDNALEGTTRATALTQRLLAFSRQQPLSPEAVDINRLMAGLSDLLTRSLGEMVQLETVLGAGVWKAKVDQNQLESAVVNLAVNARDAMPEGGKLTIDTTNVYIDTDYAREVEVSAGQYVLIAVSDTGTGMPPEVLAKAFDPFFTTKSVGKGTGLGLSQVYGFVRQSGGHIRAYSEVGHGTSFKIYLPRFWGEERPQPRPITAQARPGQPGETVLVVEDEDRVRAVSVAALRELGYTVRHAANGREALSLINQGLDVSLLFTDVVMPEMTGRQLVDEVQKLRPDMRVLFTTGYTRNAVVHNGVVDPGTNLLPKPFTLDQLAAKVREVLDDPF